MIVNLTQHPASADQLAVGVVDLTGEELASLKSALTFDNLPSRQDIEDRSDMIAVLAIKAGAKSAMIGGAPYLMGDLERQLDGCDISPLYAFSVRETEEQVQADGSIRKVAVFRHAGFVPAVV